MNQSWNIIQQHHKLFFKNNGYLVLHNQLSYKLKKHLLQAAFDIEFDSLNKNTKHMHKFELNTSKNKTILRSEYFSHNNQDINKIINDSTLNYVINNISNSEYTLYKEKINYKYPNTGIFKPHQDITAYPNSNNFITCLIPLCNTYKLNGSIQFSPLINNNLKNNTILPNNNGVILNSDKLKWDKPINTNFGDIILFNSYIPHKSSQNLSNEPRKSLYLTFNKSSEGNLRDDYYNIKKKTEFKDSTKISLIEHFDGSILNNKTSNSLNKDYVINNIINLYKNYGNSFYDKNITQTQHAFSTMNMAIQSAEPEYFQLASFLHDIGHLILNESDNNHDFLKKNLHHELIAYNFLKQYFPDKITKPILNHVYAKRYLCSQFKPYYDNLSESSKKSFKIQGGFLSHNSIKKFEKTKYFNDTVKLRQYEDKSKKNKHNNIILNFDYVEKLLHKFYI